MEKLKRDKSRTETRIKKASESDGQIKFPIKDELIEIFVNEPNGPLSGKSSKPLPEPYLNLENLLPDVNISDALAVWDFLHVFGYEK